MKRERKTAKIEVRCTEKEKNLWRTKAKLHSKKNISEFVRECIAGVKK